MTPFIFNCLAEQLLFEILLTRIKMKRTSLEKISCIMLKKRQNEVSLNKLLFNEVNKTKIGER